MGYAYFLLLWSLKAFDDTLARVERFKQLQANAGQVALLHKPLKTCQNCLMTRFTCKKPTALSLLLIMDCIIIEKLKGKCHHQMMCQSGQNVHNLNSQVQELY